MAAKDYRSHGRSVYRRSTGRGLLRHRRRRGPVQECGVIRGAEGAAVATPRVPAGSPEGLRPFGGRRWLVSPLTSVQANNRPPAGGIVAGTIRAIERRSLATHWQRRHILVALTFLACVIAYTDRVNISVAAVA